MHHCRQMIFLIFLFFGVRLTNAANILYLSALPSPSHHIWNSALANALAAKGHNVTVASLDKDNNPPNGVHYIQFEGIYNENLRKIQKGLFDWASNMNPLFEPIKYDNHWYESCKAILQTNGFRRLLNYPNDFSFELIIHDFTAGGCLLGFVHKFKNPPVVSVTAYGNPTYLNTFIGGHQCYSYIPHNYLHYEGDMNFFQRMYNFAVHLIEYYYHKEVFSRKIDDLISEHFDADVPSVAKLEEMTTIALVNTNPAMDYLAPLPENVIPVGGLHIRDAIPLPEELETFINSSAKGAVLFSLGTNVRSSLLDREKQKILLDAFELLPEYNFMWKFEDPSINLKLPKNVLIQQWIPQSDVLAHPKIKAFFSHSGLLSTQETIHRGVPVIGMPFAYDQHRNLLKSIDLGIAEMINFHTMTTSEIRDKLKILLENPKYTKNVKELSKRFKDQKEKPIDRAVWWIEWLLRNPKSEFMKSPVIRLGYIIGNSYDLVAFSAFVSILFLYFSFKIFLWVLRSP